MRILALDYGKKRCGIAVTDELQIIASGLTTVASDELMPFLEKYFASERVSKVLVGQPLQMDNTPSESAALIDEFVRGFEKKFPDMPVIRVDERFTSKLAVQAMIDSGLKKKQRQNKALIDEIAATIMLRDFLTRNMI